MPIVKTSLLQDGDTPVAATLNQPYDDVATASATIDNTNTRDNWITRFHFAGNNACNDLYTFKYQGTAESKEDFIEQCKGVIKMINRNLPKECKECGLTSAKMEGQSTCPQCLIDNE